MKSSLFTPVLVDATTSGRILSDDNSKLTGQKMDVSLADLHSSAGDSEHPDKTWKTQTKLSTKDHSTVLPLGGLTIQWFSSLHRSFQDCQFNRKNNETGQLLPILFVFRRHCRWHSWNLVLYFIGAFDIANNQKVKSYQNIQYLKSKSN